MARASLSQTEAGSVRKMLIFCLRENVCWWLVGGELSACTQVSCKELTACYFVCFFFFLFLHKLRLMRISDFVQTVNLR